MDTTGRRRLFTRPTTRLALLALVAALFFGLQAVYLGGTAHAATFTVNSVGDAGDDDTPDDSICETGTPGQCTLRAAIEEANDTPGSDTITFDASLFTVGSPATIKLAAELPLIDEDLIINADNRGVILDGSNLICGSQDGLSVRTDDFQVHAKGGSFRITGFCDDGIDINGDGANLNSILINAVQIDDIADNGILFRNFVAATSVTVSTSQVEADDDAIVFAQNGSAKGNNAIHITNNPHIQGDFDGNGAGEGVDIDLEGDLSSTITINVNDNGDIESGDDSGVGGEDAIDIEYCQDVGGCAGVDDVLTINVNNNDSIAGGDEGIDIEVDADDGNVCCTTGTGSDNFDVNININGNGPITGDNDKAIDIFNRVCCGSSDSATTINVNNNGNLTSNGDDAVQILTSGCCGNNNDSTVSVNGNGNIVGGSGDGVDIRSRGGSDADASSNSASNVTVNDNGDITGMSGEGVFIQGRTGSDSGDADGNQTNASVSGNGAIEGDGDGVEIIANAGSANADADNNSITVDVNNNDEIESTGCCDNGVRVSATTFADSDTGDNNDITVNITGNGNIYSTEDAVNVEASAGDGSDHDVTVHVDNNATISTTVSGDGVDVETNICCGTSDSTATTTVDGNEDIIGNGGDGVALDAEVCCGDGNSSTMSASNNRDITGNGGFGVSVDSRAGQIIGTDLEASDNTSTVNVDGNRNIEGGGNDGVSVASRAGSDDAADAGGDSDGNTSTVSVSDNNNIFTSNFPTEDFGVFIDTRAGANIFTVADGSMTGSSGNATDTTVSGNNDITGILDGVFVGALVCCDDANTNAAEVNGNDDIIGDADDGGAGNAINIAGPSSFFLCCSQNTINVQNNTGLLTSVGGAGGGTGILIRACGDPVSDTLDTDCLATSQTIATISGNEISDNDDRGIDICCGNFGTVGGTRSSITNNVIANNDASGIYVNSASGIVIGPSNTITLNGSGTGVTVVESNIDGTDVEADGNTITRNSIFDNVDLGIDLDDDGTDDDVTQCSDSGTDPNQCLKRPTLSLFQGSTLLGVGCGGCKIEVFVADNSPADQDDDDGDPSGEGKTFIIDTTAASDGSWSVKLCNTPAGSVTATQTNAEGNTSEFGKNLAFSGTTQACATPTNTTGPTNTPAATATSAGTATPTRTSTPAATQTPTTGPSATPTNTVVAPPTATNTTVAPAATATNTAVPATATRTATRTATPITKDCGDVNDSGSVNSIDAALILQLEAALINSLINEASADVNDDGEINSVDAALILQLEANLITDLDCLGGAGAGAGTNLDAVLDRVLPW